MPSNKTLFAIHSPAEQKAQLFWVLYEGVDFTDKDLSAIRALISDPVDQELWVNPDKDQFLSLGFPEIQIVHFQPGVTDNPASAFSELLEFSEYFRGKPRKVHSGEAYYLRTSKEKFRANPLIQRETSLSELNKIEFPEAEETPVQIQTYDLKICKDEELITLSQENHWALSLDEMKVIQKEFSARPITDAEIEMLAQTWSEHCKHKIFNAVIEYTDEEGHIQIVQGLFKTFIKGPTDILKKKKDWLVSVFSDNAGIVRFHDGVDVCIKVETHNSPSALDPYGGALTGILGVNRDILGTGLGARPIANTNVLCFGYPDETEKLPEGLLHPRDVFQGVHKGIQDGGNKSGIPTVNGAISFDNSFVGKPLVFCGTIGVLPASVHGIPSATKGQKPGDYVVMVGGKVGLDGIHGATSSSLAMDSKTPSSMVQIGDPLTQKRMADFLLQARDLGLYSSITDNGAGGLSSSVGEMAEATGGARLYLDRVPLKQSGLQPWQILVSESQERMTVAIPPAKWSEFKKLSEQYGVLSTVIGEFASNGKIECLYKDEKILDLSMEFLHQGLPQMKLKAKAQSGGYSTTWKQNAKALKKITTAHDILQTLLSDLNLASKESWIRQYDHEVQAATVLKPFEGNGKTSAPNDGAVVDLFPHGSKRRFEGIAVGSGIASRFSKQDVGLMALMAADEAVRNIVVSGADPEKIALIDNFCWPDSQPSSKNPDAEKKLGDLVKCCSELSRLVSTYEMPLISGKDSMKNDFYGKKDGNPVKISVLPTLLVTALGFHPDVTKAVKPHAREGLEIYLLGSQTGDAYFGMSLPEHFTDEAFSEFSYPKVDLQQNLIHYKAYHEAVQSGLITAAHDLSEGGLLLALFESLMFHRSGATLEVPQNLASLCNEDLGRILVFIAPENKQRWETQMKTCSMQYLGKTTSTPQLQLQFNQRPETIELENLVDSWKKFC